MLIRLLSGNIYGSPDVGQNEAFTTIERAEPTGCTLRHRFQVEMMGGSYTFVRTRNSHAMF